MAVTIIPWWIVLIWAVFATVFYLIRYKDVEFLRNPFIIGGIFAVHMFFFAWSAVMFIIFELIRSKMKKKEA